MLPSETLHLAVKSAQKQMWFSAILVIFASLVFTLVLFLCCCLKHSCENEPVL